MLVFTYIKHTLWLNDKAIMQHKVGITPESTIQRVKHFKGLFEEHKHGELVNVTFGTDGIIYANYRILKVDES